MAEKEEDEKVILPHHEQQTVCTTRLPYRQGRKLTAIKVYTVNNESNHLLIFGVPSLKLRQEVKSLFAPFGKLLLFAITTQYPTEPFTENYHAVFERIQSARIAKKVLDTKNFYGGSLHVCYAPELEEISETRNKILQRKKDILNRLKNLQKEKETTKKEVMEQKTTKTTELLPNKKLNMGEVNIIGVGKQIRDVVLNKNKRKKLQQPIVIEKRFKPCYVNKEATNIGRNSDNNGRNSDNNGRNSDNDGKNSDNNGRNKDNNLKIEENSSTNDKIEIIDFTSAETDAITNINDCLNYNKFGNEIIKKIPDKPVNKIKFNIGNKR